jgi:hypothetical protein
LRTQRRTKVFVSTIVAAIALTALLAASASAAIVPAKFSNPGLKLSGSGLITLKKNGLEPKTCELKLPVEAYAEGNQFLGGNAGLGETKFSCTSGSTTLAISTHGEVHYDTVTGAYSVHVFDHGGTTQLSPYGWYTQAASEKFRGKWTNGSGATASTVAFTEAPIGYIGGKLITLSGTLKATTSTGALITLSH